MLRGSGLGVATKLVRRVLAGVPVVKIFPKRRAAGNVFEFRHREFRSGGKNEGSEVTPTQLFIGSSSLLHRFSRMSKKAVLFIHGRGGNPGQWNASDTGRTTNIEKSIAATGVKTLCVDIPDFNDDPEGTLDRIFTLTETIDALETCPREWILVGHSLGAIYALALSFLPRKLTNIKAVVLVDPTPFDCDYIDKLHDRGWKNLAGYVNRLFRETGDPDISPKIRFHVHLDFTTTFSSKGVADFFRKVEFYTRYTKPNVKSRLQIHPDKGHMLLHSDAPKILNSVLEAMMGK